MEERKIKILKAFKYKLKPNKAQTQFLFQQTGCCRLVWNKAVGLIQEKRKQAGYEKYYLPYHKKGQECTSAMLTEWKRDPELVFLKEIHSTPLQQCLRDLHKAYQDGFKKIRGSPNFKKKFQKQSFRYVQGVKIEHEAQQVYLPKAGWCRFVKSREIEGKVKNTTVSFEAGHWYVSFQVELEIPQPVHNSDSKIGVDVGIVHFAALSDGTYQDRTKQEKEALEKIELRKKKLQRVLARKQGPLKDKRKASNNWNKQKQKVNRCCHKIACIRQDFRHKQSTLLSKNHAWVCVEKLAVKQMSKSAKGTKEKPGKNVKQKADLNRSILEQGWYEFKRQLGYKLAWQGGELVEVAAQYTSQKCSSCGHTAKANRKKQDKFACVSCRHKQNADTNAAKNILAAGLAVLAINLKKAS